MSVLEISQHIVDHAERFGISKLVHRVLITPHNAELSVRPGELGHFLAWAKHMDRKGRELRGLVPCNSDVGIVYVKGQLLSGHIVIVSVSLPGEWMRTADLIGPLVLGEVEQAARKGVAA